MKWASLGLLLLLIPTATAAPAFDPFVDPARINWFDREIYFGAVHQGLPCINLQEYFAYADSDPFDRYDRESIKKYKDRLGFFDYQDLANFERGDNINVDDFNKRRDFQCSNFREFSTFADSNRGDRFDRDDFFRLVGSRNERQFFNRLSHPRTELAPVYHPNVRSYDGGFASISPRRSLPSYFGPYGYSRRGTSRF